VIGRGGDRERVSPHEVVVTATGVVRKRGLVRNKDKPGRRTIADVCKPGDFSVRLPPLVEINFLRLSRLRPWKNRLFACFNNWFFPPPKGRVCSFRVCILVYPDDCASGTERNRSSLYNAIFKMVHCNLGWGGNCDGWYIYGIFDTAHRAWVGGNTSADDVTKLDYSRGVRISVPIRNP
jgi:hypothetical protein